MVSVFIERTGRKYGLVYGHQAGPKSGNEKKRNKKPVCVLSLTKKRF
jgi:hypothetical protein